MSAGRTISPKTVALALGDALAAGAAIAIALVIRHGGSPDPSVIALYRFAGPFLIATWLAGFTVFGLYDLRQARNDPQSFERLAKALLFDFAATAILFYLVPEFRLRPLVTLIVIFPVFGALVGAWRGAFNAIAARVARSRVLFLGVTPEIVSLARFLADQPQWGLDTAGFAHEAGAAPPEALPAPVFDAAEGLAAVVRREKIDTIVVAGDAKRDRRILKALLAVTPLGVAVTDFPRLYEAVYGKVPVARISEAWFIENLIGTRRPKYEALKRALDLTLAIAVGASALVILPVVAAAIALSTSRDILRYRERRARPGDGLVFFRQPRVGRSGRIFNFIKFRSQVLGAERHGGEKHEGSDPRAYTVGTILRKTYLDELPQILNVMKGEMSFVGPRPERPEFVRELERAIPFYRTRELVTPGITGWAQINMPNDASVSDAPEKLQYDLYYIKNRSIALDLTILLKTALKLLQRSGR